MSPTPWSAKIRAAPIYGIPSLNVDKPKTVIVVKCSLSAGFVGPPNLLLARVNTLMSLGDGKQAVLDLTSALNEAA